MSAPPATPEHAAAAPAPAAAPALLEMRGIRKAFPGVQALDGVDFTVRAGEIHALLGENGAGKSTLVKVLTGVHRRDAGTVRLAGRSIDPRTPRAAEALGISTVHQEINLVPHLSIAENIVLGREPRRWGLIRWGAVRARARAALARLELGLDVRRELAACSIAVQQMVALARALDVSARLLVLDEPTSSLDADEVAELFTVLRRLRTAGLGIVFITHFLEQVYTVSDRITILRDGLRVGEFATAALPRAALVAHMLGRPVNGGVASETGPAAPLPPTPGGPPLLAARGLGRRGAVTGVDLDLRPGETVGLAGLLGSGRTETARLLFGVDRADRGELRIDGRPVRLRSPRQAIRRGLAFTPEDRKVAGLVPHLSVRENIILALQARRGVWRRLSRRRQLALVERFIAALGIRTPGPEQAVTYLSGGTQQKVLLARWLANQPRLLILDEPTRGIDVGAKAEVEKLVATLRAEGLAILFISSELDEVARTCHRVLVLRDRRPVATLAGAEVSVPAIMAAIARAGDAD